MRTKRSPHLYYSFMQSYVHQKVEREVFLTSATAFAFARFVDCDIPVRRTLIVPIKRSENKHFSNNIRFDVPWALILASQDVLIWLSMNTRHWAIYVKNKQ